MVRPWIAGLAFVMAGACIAVAVARPDDGSVPEPKFTRAAWVSTPVLTPTTTSTSTTVAPTTTTTVAPTTTTTVAPTTTTTEPKHLDGNRGRFALAPNATLPTEKECAKQVTKTREARPENSTANHTTPKGKLNITNHWGSDPAANKYASRVTGNFTGTTDEILQWASCKWGLDVDISRAQAMKESSWHQGSTAAVTEDQAKCPGATVVPCPLAFGLMQIRSDYHPNTYPWSASSTAFNVDYTLAMRRACYDGHLWVGPTAQGDAWGCVGVHYSGKLRDEKALQYIARVQAIYDNRGWPRE